MAESAAELSRLSAEMEEACGAERTDRQATKKTSEFPNECPFFQGLGGGHKIRDLERAGGSLQRAVKKEKKINQKTRKKILFLASEDVVECQLMGYSEKALLNEVRERQRKRFLTGKYRAKPR